MSPQKTIKPSAEDVIPDVLSGDMRERALQFATYMRENKMPLKMYTTSRQSQSANYRGKTICQLYLYAAMDKNCVLRTMTGAQSWIVIPSIEHLSIYEDIIVNEGLQNILWENPYYCVWGENSELSGEKERGCAPTKGCVGGVDIALCGKTLKDVCRWRTNPFVRNPDDVQMEAIKRLLELERKARDGS